MLKKILILIFLVSNGYFVFPQYIKSVAVFYSNSSAYSGIFGISDTAVWNYSWFYGEWLPLSNNGLVRHGNIVQLKLIAVYNDGTSTTEGLYVVSDTAVFNYSWYLAEWLPLENTGLIRKNDTVQLSSISVYQNGSQTSSGIFAVSDTAVFKYEWYTHEWNPLSNNGLHTSKNIILSNEYNYSANPNPFTSATNITYSLPPGFNDWVRIAVYDYQGQFVKEIVNEKQTEGNYSVEFKSTGIPAGIYFYEIFGKGICRAKRMAKLF
ncbi:MAG: T9SS type A sorting domain-containing protein [Bacteroidia bacterium]|nr:T9SS type A sorting domain-containing protein [Bacteroidia bacterium]